MSFFNEFWGPPGARGPWRSPLPLSHDRKLFSGKKLLFDVEIIKALYQPQRIGYFKNILAIG